jgi:hypothetical protein
MKTLKGLPAFLLVLIASGCGFLGANQGATPESAGKPGGSSPATEPASTAPVAATTLAWVKYEDPLEQAFTLDVPKGWTVRGGMFRLGYSDHRIMVDMISPDGKINVRVGDVSIPVYFLPNQYHHEGEVYDLGAQARGTVARYRTGQEYAPQYGNARFKQVCQPLTPQQTTSPPPANLDPQQSSGATNNRPSDGQVTYACGGSQGSRVAYAFTQTRLSGGLWQVSNIASFIAPAGDLPLARSIIETCNKTFQLNPAWVQKQKQILVYQRERQQDRMRVLSQQVAQAEMKMQAMQNQVNQFERGQAQRQDAFQKVDNIIAGVTPTIDPLGNERNVMTGPKSGYWIEPSTGREVNADKAPGPGWQQLTIKQ